MIFWHINKKTAWVLALVQRFILISYPTVWRSNGLIIFFADSSTLTSNEVLFNGINLYLGQVSRSCIKPIPKKGNFIVQATTFSPHNFPVAEIHQNSLELLYGWFSNYNENSLTSAARNITTTLFCRNTKHFEAWISRKTSLKKLYLQMATAPFSKTRQTRMLLSSWRHDGQAHRDKQIG